MQVFETYSEEETRGLGKRLGEEAAPGSVYALIGDLGTGKTVIAKGMALGLGIAAPIVSPTFLILREYRDEGRMPFFHFDIYRLEDEDELFAIGWEEYMNGNGVCLVEWADLVPEAMPEETVWIRVTKDLAKGPDYRRIVLGEKNEILEGDLYR